MFTKFLHRPVTHIVDWLLGLFVGSLHALLVTLVYQHVPDPYMDEIFHVSQTRRYCNNDYRWDPMITTPPALYFLALPFCGGYERYVNSLLMVLAVPGFCRFRRMFARDDSLTSALAVSLLPVLLHSSALFYTDLLSLVCVVWAFSIPSTLLASIFFLVACLTRQTNIVWAGLYALARMYHRFQSRSMIRSTFSSVVRLCPFVLLAISFLFFVYANGGIVLGDASAHQPKIHLAQLLYLSLFAALHSWPHALYHIPYLVYKCIRPTSLILLFLILVSIHYCSFDHPYLLADNRHVPFYLWRWWLADPTKRLSLAPLYLVAMFYLNRLSRNIPFIIRVMFFLSTLAVVVPAHLIEPRYFIIPYVLWRLSANTSSSLIVIFMEICSQLLIFSIVMYIFLFKPFEWSNEPGVMQRFMW